MSIPTSPVIPACQWLVGQLQSGITPDARANLWVGYGPNVGPQQPDDQVFISRAESKFEPFGMVGTMGARALQETLEIRVTVSVARESQDDGQVIFERLASLVNAVVSTVRADPTMGGNVLRAAPDDVTYPAPERLDDDEGWFAAETEVVISSLVID